jgi:hypothetical protein
MKTPFAKTISFLFLKTCMTISGIDVETDEKLALKYLTDYGYLSKSADVTKAKGELER